MKKQYNYILLKILAEFQSQGKVLWSGLCHLDSGPSLICLPLVSPPALLGCSSWMRLFQKILYRFLPTPFASTAASPEKSPPLEALVSPSGVN